MKPYRRAKQRACTGPRIVSASSMTLSDIAALPSATRDAIGAADDLVCAVNIDGPNHSYTLLIDLGWLSMAIEVHHRDDELIEGLLLPRPAIRAVINGWDMDVMFIGSVVQWSDDDIPHIGFADADLAFSA